MCFIDIGCSVYIACVCVFTESKSLPLNVLNSGVQEVHIRVRDMRSQTVENVSNDNNMFVSDQFLQSISVQPENPAVDVEYMVCTCMYIIMSVPHPYGNQSSTCSASFS